MDFDMSLQSRV